MNAIAGLWRLDGRGGAGVDCLAMLDAQRIHGPDARDHWSGGDIALGRNLARLVPEDRFDAQPLVGRGGRFLLVADLRLDNRTEIGSALGFDGRHIAELADSALLLAAWERWEEGSVERIVGDFAFALWDAERRALILARDHAAGRPLHFHAAPAAFAFASMPKGLHALEGITRAPDLDFAARVLAEGMPPASGSWFAGIERVPPGHLLTASAAGVSRRRWWHPPVAPLRLKSSGDYAEALRHHLDEAVRCRLRGASDVAAHLSGGLDSSAVATSAAHLLAPAGQVTAFTALPRAGYCDSRSPPMLDEGSLADATAAAWPNIRHVRLPAAGPLPLDQLDDYATLFDQPLPNLCNMPWMTAIADAARERGVKVLLTGQYGNFGFSYDGILHLSDLLQHGRLLALAGRMLALRRSGFVPVRSSAAAAVRPLLAGWTRSLRRLSGATLAPAVTGERALRLRALELNDLGNLTKGELGRSGIDCRDPTADRRLIEFCLTIPLEEFMRGGIPRSPARRALVGRVPETVLTEPRKAVQAPDWHEPASAQRGALAAELDAFAATPAAALLPLDRLHAMIDAWPEADWARPIVSRDYRSRLLRPISVAHFLRHAARPAATLRSSGDPMPR